MSQVLKGPTEAEEKAHQTKLHIQQIAREAGVSFLKIGALLYKAQEDADWSILGYESFREYVEDLELPVQSSWSWATRLIGITKYLDIERGLNEQELLEIGVAKCTRLLPVARRGELTDELVEDAKVLSDADLQVKLGGKVREHLGERWIVCNRCGAIITGAKWV